MQRTKRIALWSGPRNVSTALMYAFAQREDTTVVDEPLFGYFLQHTGVWRPSREEALAAMELDPEVIISDLLAGAETSTVFHKHMANHLVGLDWGFLDQCVNVILTRDPGQMLTSYAVNMEQPTMLDVCYQMQVELLDHLTQRNLPVMVLDSKDILLDPEEKLTELCTFCNIPFDPSMLHWEAGARPEDGVWAKYWYHSVHKSTGFAPYREKDERVPEHLIPLLNESVPLYQQLINS